MCFGGSKKEESSVLTDPRAFFQYWRPPEIGGPNLKLHEEVFGREALRRKRLGYKRFQIPLNSQKNKESGLGIPAKDQKGG